MKFLFSIPIAILFNMFTRSIADKLFYGIPLKERYDKYIYFYIVVGILGIVISNIISDSNYKNNKASMGLKYGGYALLLSTLIFDWSHVSDSVKMSIIGGGLFYIIWLAYN